jgi:hypothetical protein
MLYTARGQGSGPQEGPFSREFSLRPRQAGQSGSRFKGRRLRVASTLVAALALLVGAGASSSRCDAPALDTVLADAVAPGWSRQGPSRGFTADDLWEYVDGDADRYVDLGLSGMRTATYRESDLTLAFHVGVDFVRVIAYDMTPETTEALRTLGRALAARLRADATKPRGPTGEEARP